MCDCEEAERREAAVRSRNAKSDAEFKGKFVDKFSRQINLNDAQGVDLNDDSESSLDSEDEDDEFFQKLKHQRKNEIENQIKVDAKRKSDMETISVKKSSSLQEAFKAVRESGAILLILDGSGATSDNLLNYIKKLFLSDKCFGMVSIVYTKTNLSCLPLSMAYIQNLPALACFWNSRILMVKSDIKRRKDRYDHGTENNNNTKTAATTLNTNGKPSINISDEFSEESLNSIEHWIEKLSQNLENRPNPHCGREKCRVGYKHIHTCEDDHEDCDHHHKVGEKDASGSACGAAASSSSMLSIRGGRSARNGSIFGLRKRVGDDEDDELSDG